MKWIVILFAVITTTCAFDGPDKISENVKIIFTRDIFEVVYLPLGDLKYLMTQDTFDPTLPTAFYVHGWLESGVYDISTLAVRGAYIDRGDHNIVTIDWSYYSKDIDYFRVIPQLKIIAETIATSILQLVANGFDINTLHLVGHSLGGQMVGKIGRQVKELSGGKIVIPRIYALDPAGPGFDDNFIDGFEPITKRDTAYVQVIHTSSGVLGMRRRVGHVDFYPNGGTDHPGCNVDVAASVIKIIGDPCNHFRSYQFFQVSVRDPKAFPATRCDSWDDFLTDKTSCHCDDVDYMGFGGNVTNTGKYFLQTNSNIFNLARGMRGIRYKRSKKIRLRVPTIDGKFVNQTVPEDVKNNSYF